MSLSFGTSPFGHRRAGRFTVDVPDDVVYVEPFPRRVRAIKDGKTVVDSDRVVLVHESRRLPRYAFPREDVGIEAQDEPHVEGHVNVSWDAVDVWYEEDEEVHVHVRDPYHRIDVLPTSRSIEVSLRGETLAESTSALALYETGLPIRYYLPVHDVRMRMLEASDTLTRCAYKGTALHWSARIGGELDTDVAWSYDDVRRDGEPIRGRIAFYGERVDIDVDGVRQARPQTPWSR